MIARAIPRAVVLLVAVATTLIHAATPPAARFVTYEEAWPVLQAAHQQPTGSTLGGPRVPPELASADPQQARGAFAAWVRERDAEVRARVLQGEEDSLAALLLFGTSFTRAPRITREYLETAARDATSQTAAGPAVEEALVRAFRPRIDDLLRALQQPGTNERLQWARATLARLGHRLDTAENRARAGRYLIENFARVNSESAALSAALDAAARLPDRSQALAERARIFAGRGLAPDTSWPIDFALASSLASLAHAGTIAPGSVHRVAIVGPGLDFTDKDEGHDYYPPQSLQPFALIDALLSTGLATGQRLDLVTFDVNPRVNEHLRGLASRPVSRPYDLQLVRSRAVEWTAPASRYFESLGAAIGASVEPISPPASAGPLHTRAIRVAPQHLRRVTPVDLNIVFQRLDLSAQGRFQLVVATNVLLYYDLTAQALAAANIASMLAPGGLLLTNTRLDDVPGFQWRVVAEHRHVFSSRPGDGEVIYAYAPLPPAGHAVPER